MGDELQEKVNRSIGIIRLAARMSRQYYDAPLIITYSGGKDSDTLADLAVKSGAEVEFIHSITTVDAPETMRHVKETFKALEGQGYKTTIRMPEMPMWKLIVKTGLPPFRAMRYCCKYYKENETPNRYSATGVRAAESQMRKNRAEFEIKGKKLKDRLHFTAEHVEEVYQEAQEMDEAWNCQFITAAKKHKDLICNPIIDWTDYDVWEYIRENNIKYNPLYDRGYKRVGCIGCPLAGRNGRLKEFADYPGYQRMYMRAFELMLKHREETGKPARQWKTAQEVFDWWMEDPNIPGQMSFDDYMEDKGDRTDS